MGPVLKDKVKQYILTFENMEPINCIVAIVLGGSLASIPSNAFEREVTIRSLSVSTVLLSSD
jgi:hypothetical protein